MKLVKNRRLLDATLLAGAIILASVVLWAHAQERHDLPPFDYKKAEQLSPEKRVEYERSLFNELDYWNTGTPRYMGKDGTNRREADWMSMAQNGYELAYIALQVLQPSTGIRYAARKPLARLTELADRGDASAMCMYTLLSNVGSERERDEYREQGRAYWRRGAEIGHPACLSRVGFFLMNGIQGFPKDVPAGFDASVKAERAGYDGAGSIAVYLARQEIVSAMEWMRYYCWQIHASQYSTYANPKSVLRELRNQTEMPESRILADRLEAWHPTLDECIALKLGDR
ncbi:hypothetical protein [Cupriavidus alkaliphilus]|uniref:hypothetical protein n=1 Tax=Cupriavidus alkaliphilus TaxID=942866 RepID=UPI0016222A05|nr:hypothetical protein [Cupriavidus alkaliphilus]MBB3014958.1 hypothetical protein [Cupriavidus alkaliphilus]